MIITSELKREITAARLVAMKGELAAARAEATRWHSEYQAQRNAAIAAEALLAATPDELRQRVIKAGGVAEEQRQGLRRYETQYQRQLAELAAARAEIARLHEIANGE